MILTMHSKKNYFLYKKTHQQFRKNFLKYQHKKLLIYRDDRNFQLRNKYAATLNTTNITINATISNVKLASNISNSSRVVSGDLK